MRRAVSLSCVSCFRTATSRTAPPVHQHVPHCFWSEWVAVGNNYGLRFSGIGYVSSCQCVAWCWCLLWIRVLNVRYTDLHLNWILVASSNRDGKYFKLQWLKDIFAMTLIICILFINISHLIISTILNVLVKQHCHNQHCVYNGISLWKYLAFPVHVSCP